MTLGSVGKMYKIFLSLLLVWSLPGYAKTDTAAAGVAREYDVFYDVTLKPKKDYAKVVITLPKADLLKGFTFRLDTAIHSHVKANGSLQLKDEFARWVPPKRNAKLQLRVKISNERKKGMFDAKMTEDWAIFRGDDLVPPASVEAKRGAKSRSYLRFHLPRGWHSVNTGWERDKSSKPKGKQKNPPHFLIDNPERRFDRPTGWMIAGNVATRRDWAGSTRISVSAPKGTLFHRMDILTYLNFVWPEVEKAFGDGPSKLLIVGGDDPMWRGGLSASNSLFLHADRPLVSENGTSTLIHEVVHMFTRIRGAEKDDWIAEGLAEYYAVELLFRAGGMSAERKEKVQAMLRRWSADVEELRIGRSSGPVTARAALLFFQLDEEIRHKTKGEHSMDTLTRELMKKRKISYQHIRQRCRALVGAKCETLQGL